MTSRDRAFARFTMVRAVGPLHGIGAGAVRQALATLHERDPGNRLVCRLDPAARNWVPVPADGRAALLDGLVEDAPQASPRDVANALLNRESRTPLRLVVAGSTLGVQSSHALADGRAFGALLPELIEAARTGDPPATPFEGGRPLTAAITRTFGRRPARILRGVRAAMPLGPARDMAAGGADSRGAGRPLAAALATGTLEPEVLSGLRAWRDRRAPDASLVAVIAAVLRRALGEEGLPPAERGLRIMVDARRYLAPGDPTDPASVGDALRDAVDAGAPLVLLAALAARHALPGGEGPVRSVRPAAPSGSGPSAAAGPHLALTALGRVSLPGAEPGVEYVIAPTPSGPQWATACVVEVGGALHVSATWYPEVLGDAAMRAALARAARDPVGLLS